MKKESKRKIVAMISKVLRLKLAFDGESLLISPRALKGFDRMSDQDCEIDEDRRGNGCRFRVTYQLGDKEETAEGELEPRQVLETKKIHDYISGNDVENYPMDIIQAIEILLRTQPALQAA